MKLICTIYDDIEAMALRDYFIHEGVFCVIEKQDVGGARPSLGFTLPIRVLVDPANFDKAVSLYADWQKDSELP